MSGQKTKTKTKKTSYELFDHQLKCLDLATKHDRYGFFLDTGTGKTLVGLRLAQAKKVKTLVVCPLRVILAWLEDADKFVPDLFIKSGWDKTGAKKTARILADDYDILVINPDTFRRHIQDLKSVGFQMLIFDESSLLKNYSAKITKEVIKFTKDLKYVYLMSGTPAPNNLMEYWAQMHIVNPEILPGSPWAVQNRYWMKPRSDLPWLLVPRRKGVEEEFMRRVGLGSVSIKKKDCLDLPEQVFKKEYVSLKPKQLATYKEMLEDWIVEFKGSEAVAANKLAQLMKLRQITAGFIYNEQGEPIYQGAGKTEALLEILDENADQQVLVFGQFRYEIDHITEAIKAKGITCDRIYGGVNLNESEEIVNRFKSGESRVLIAHPKSVGHGLTFINCHLTIWASLDYSYETFYQANQRTHRHGQQHSTTHICLIAEDTVDEMIYKVVTGKEEMNNALMGMIKLEN